MRRTVGWILLTVYIAFLLWMAAPLVFGGMDGYEGIPIVLATLPWSLFFVWALRSLSVGSSQLWFYGPLIVSAALNIMTILLIGGLPPFHKRHQTGTKEI